jgi:predicted MFS family arabinose efflux permease
MAVPVVVAGVAGLLAAMVVTYTGINLQRSPVQALLADIVPSRYRSIATGSVTFQMCVGGVVFLMLGRTQGLRAALLCAAATVLAIAAAFSVGLRRRTTTAASASVPEGTFRAIVDAVRSMVRGEVPGMRAIFLASLLLQLTFQTFTTWYSLHATERLAVSGEEVAVGMIAWALGGVIGALPAGAIGMRIGRRNAMLAGFASMVVCLLALHLAETIELALPLLALISASWTLPMVNGYPLFVEPVPPPQRGVLAAIFLLSMALGGAIGDPLNGLLFDLSGSYRPLFLWMAVYTALAFAAVMAVPPGAGEADAGPLREQRH